MSDQRWAQHRWPVWRDRSNFIITADIPTSGTAEETEQLWALKVSDCQFELCCIPFFVYDIALGDIVETINAGTRMYLVNRVVEPSGRYVFRVWFGEVSHHPHHDVEAALTDLGALIEWSSTNMCAVDARDAAHAQVIADYLAEREDAGDLIYETGRTA